MKRLFVIFAIGAVGILAACEDTSRTVAPAGKAPASLTVFVQFDGQGVPDRHIEVLEAGLSGDTDDTGLVTFSLPPGDYTVRAYGINRGGPALLYLDTPVKVDPGQKVEVEIFDCLICV